ncbi:MAG: UDP-2,3-diacylglucosamine diphosphatase [Sulfuritalea sp.]|jgi:UDP-2,3-diacylglucosamine hydrolase|nr:UDP-2,3-diacylglucosamine diphosphatase [Sulfuritalea sp.]
MLTVAGTARFVSDLHLRAERPDLTERFAAFLTDTAAAKVEALFILGDLFEYWIGDDDLADPFNAQVCKLLRGLADQGTRIFFIAGNRDFLIGETFAAAAGITLLAETETVGAGGTPTLLMHGDTVCTDDIPYQEFRRMVRSKQWQADFLATPLPERRTEVENLRRRSAAAMRGKTVEIMDTNAAAIRAALTAHGCTRLIHGHTHRPGHEDIALADGTAERWVLSDWDTGRGDALEISAAGVRRIDLSAYSGSH